MLARVRTFAIDGVQPRQVWVEVDIRSGLPAFTIVGLGDTAVRESRDRIRAAILNSGFEFPATRITANLAPAVAAQGRAGIRRGDRARPCWPPAARCRASALARYAVFGELSLGGELRDSPGALAVAEGAAGSGCARLIVPRERAREAALVGGLRIVAVTDLRAAAAVLAGRASRRRCPRRARARRPMAAPSSDLADVRGHGAPLLALEIAAAGGHNLLMEGAPGTGKTMLARRHAVDPARS